MGYDYNSNNEGDKQFNSIAPSSATPKKWSPYTSFIDIYKQRHDGQSRYRIIRYNRDDIQFSDSRLGNWAYNSDHCAFGWSENSKKCTYLNEICFGIKINVIRFTKNLEIMNTKKAIAITY